MIQIGVIGCGKIAQTRHLPEYADNGQCRICAVYDVNQARREQIAEQYGAVACATYQQLLELREIDAVSVCTANATHAEITIAALKAGKHVLCEKPMATTLAECEAMVQAAEASGKYLMIGHNQRLTKAHTAARALIEDGVIGTVLRFRSEFSHCGPETWGIDPGRDSWFFDKKRAALGAMADLGVHKTDLIEYLTGKKITKVTAQLRTLDKRTGDGALVGVDDNALCIYELEDGCVGTMTASWTNYGAENNATVLYGTQGVMHIYEDPQYAIVVEKKGGEKICYALDHMQTNDHQTKSGLIDAWIGSLVSHTPPELSGRDALRVMRAVFAAEESSRTGRQLNV